MARVHNFGAGPAALPLPVLEQIQAELLDWQGTGMSVLETSHRSKEFGATVESAESGLRRLMGIGDDYAVLFLQGGASMQFCMLPMNVLNGGTADYIDTGSWSTKAIKEAKRFGTVNIPFSGKDGNYTRVPADADLKLTDGAVYTHITSNNTIAGTQYPAFPASKAPLCADMSSDILSRPVDVSSFGCIYAGAQKNIGPSGLALVILRKDLAERAGDDLPTMLNYNTHIEKKSLFNTPPTLPILFVDLVCKWIDEIGGLEAMDALNTKKADLLYDCIDTHAGFYSCPVEKASRSKMNVVFRLPSEELEAQFIAEAADQGLKGLKGHRSVGGVRASIYNATQMDAVQTLVGFMTDFAAKNG
jgi:phosphoserine aminotransferase